MFGQQKLTTTPMMDPVQQKMMYFMPVIMTFMVKLPSGLTLYIFLSTLLGIIQQLAVNRERKGRAALARRHSGAPE